MTFAFPGQEHVVDVLPAPAAGTPRGLRRFQWFDFAGESHEECADRLLFTAGHVVFAVDGTRHDIVRRAIHNDNIRDLIEVIEEDGSIINA